MISRDELSSTLMELWDQDGAVGALANLAGVVQKCAVELSAAIEGVATELDRERRGAMSIAERVDGVSVQKTIESLLHCDRMHRDEAVDLRSNLIELLQKQQEEAKYPTTMRWEREPEEGEEVQQ